MKKIAQFVLKMMAKAILAKYRPVVIAVTGSVGKTTTKDALVHILTPYISVRASEKNFNNEIGLPLTILGCGAPGRSLLRWLGVGFRFLVLGVFRVPYPKVVVLEMGVDRPGDMRYLLSMGAPTISVVTEISASHLEFFGTLDAIAREKGELVRALSPEGTAILNADDARVWKMRRETTARTIGFGFGKRATLRAFNDSVACTEKGICGMRFKIQYDGKTLPVRLKYLIARHHLGAILAALAVADTLKINLLDAVRTAETFRLSPGRLQPIAGKNGSWIFDDTYNASPSSTIAAIRTVGDIPFGRKILVLGDMLELGPEEVSGHLALAGVAARVRPVWVLLVGRRMAGISEALFREGISRQSIAVFESPMRAAEFLVPHLQKEDVVLVKGSQGMRMELAVEILMAQPQFAEKLLCRQTPRWKEIPFEVG